jgi:hypothetical protein
MVRGQGAFISDDDLQAEVLDRWQTTVEPDQPESVEPEDVSTEPEPPSRYAGVAAGLLIAGLIGLILWEPAVIPGLICLYVSYYFFRCWKDNR